MQTATAVGIGAGIAATIGTFVIGSKITDGIAEKNPTGSAADFPATLTSLGLGAAGLVGIGAGYFALQRGNIMAGTAAIGAGVGAVLGAIGTGIGFGMKHGVGVETEAGNIFGAYNRDFDNELDLNPMWRTPEYVRRTETRHSDQDGNYTHSTYNYYDISRLVTKANTNHDDSVTRSELVGALASYDADENGRLQGAERSQYEREVGEQSWWGNWIF